MAKEEKADKGHEKTPEKGHDKSKGEKKDLPDKAPPGSKARESQAQEIKPKKIFKSDNPNFRHLVRIVNTDLPGERPIGMALQNLRGVSFMLANAICTIAKINPRKLSGDLTAEEEGRITKVLLEPEHAGIPIWMLNRRKDPETGIDHHLIGSDIKFTNENDIKFHRKIRTWIGFRHSYGQPVRGQRTKSNFRKNKGVAVARTKKVEMRK